jgi:hypothetical protein
VDPSGGFGTSQTETGKQRTVVEPPAPTPLSPTESKADAAQRRKQVEAAKRKGDDYYENGKYDEAISAYKGGLKLEHSHK